jgi:hypothetical protein
MHWWIELIDHLHSPLRTASCPSYLLYNSSARTTSKKPFFYCYVRVSSRENVFTEPLLRNVRFFTGLLHTNGCTRSASKALPSNGSVCHNILNRTTKFFSNTASMSFELFIVDRMLPCDNTRHIFSFICCSNSSDWNGSVGFSCTDYLSSFQSWWSKGIKRWKT